MEWTRTRLRFVSALWALLLSLAAVVFMFATGRTLVAALFAVPLAIAGARLTWLRWQAAQLDDERRARGTGRRDDSTASDGS